MAEISDREYELLITGLNTNATSLSATNSLITNLRLELATKYLTREEDNNSDQAIYKYIDTAVDGTAKHAEDSRNTIVNTFTERIDGLEKLFKLLLSIFIAAIGLLTGILIWIILH